MSPKSPGPERLKRWHTLLLEANPVQEAEAAVREEGGWSGLGVGGRSAAHDRPTTSGPHLTSSTQAASSSSLPASAASERATDEQANHGILVAPINDDQKTRESPGPPFTRPRHRSLPPSCSRRRLRSPSRQPRPHVEQHPHPLHAPYHAHAPNDATPEH
ncbi:hypothetical protein CALVIDRAFT_149949 [Calocera viscosa TUFC12733]|uniref:Uncharacterized protein n=1 Tax=Calocera viscosa (strain TUFC12733) TaxID=1330018 RepID=A0A167LI44_CALVF|nr:hypothetical protein CALVIDRAFT_149949 [Calocera viscosa TUFC12733]